MMRRRGAGPRFGRAKLVVALGTCLMALSASPAGATTLKHWWKADGDAVDSVAANNGALAGNTAFATGHSGQAFGFDGNGDYVSVPDAADHWPSDSFTVDAYAKTSVGTGLLALVNSYECGGSCPSGSANSIWFLGISDGGAYGEVRDADAGGPDDSGTQIITGGSGFSDDAFHQFGFIRDVEAAKLALYVDGIEVAEENLDPGAAGALLNQDGEADPLLMGAVFTGGTTTSSHELTGAIDEVRFWEGTE